MTWERLMVVGAMAMLVAGCGRAATSTGAGPTVTPSVSPSPSPTICAINPLPGLCVGRPATSQEEAAMIAVGKPAAERDLHAVDAKTCSGSQTCFQVGNPSRAMVGTGAGPLYGQLGGASGGGGAG